MDGTPTQHEVMDAHYANRSDSRWAFHYTKDPLTRYLRDRRLRMALKVIAKKSGIDRASARVLVVCGGVGGEGTYFRRQGFLNVTVSDFSQHALDSCRQLDPKLSTMLLDAENMDQHEDESWDLVVVQDGLHHLPRPALGLTEMLRVSSKAVVIIEPYYGLVGNKIGTEWERHGDAVNYVFRWNRMLLEQTTRSYLLDRGLQILPMRVWDHNVVVRRVVEKFPRRFRLTLAQAIYMTLRPFNFAGNMMVGVIIKRSSASSERLVGHPSSS